MRQAVVEVCVVKGVGGAWLPWGKCWQRGFACEAGGGYGVGAFIDIDSSGVGCCL